MQVRYVNRFVLLCMLELMTSGQALNLKGMKLINRILRNYDMAIHPNADDGGRTLVYVNIVVLEMHAIFQRQSEYGLSILLQKGWTDPRLAYSRYLSSQPEIHVRRDLYDRFWIPQFAFSNAVRTVEADNDLLSASHMTISGEGDVFMSSRHTLDLFCAFDLRPYPHDVHDCYLEIEVHRQLTEDIMMNWTVRVDVQVQYPAPSSIGDYELGDVHTDNCTDRAPDVCLRAVFRLRHGGAAPWFSVYLPTVIIVIISWFSFWVPISSRNTRLIQIAFCHSMMLLVSHSTSVDMDQVQSTKAADVWVGGGLVFVYVAVIESLVTYVLASRRRRRVWSAPSSESKDDVRHDANQPIVALTSFLRTGRVQETPSVNCVHPVDKICRVVFPIAYVTFAALYGVVYKNMSPIFFR